MNYLYDIVIIFLVKTWYEPTILLIICTYFIKLNFIDTGNTINQEIPENIYVFDSFSSDNSSDDDGENVKHLPEYPCKDRVLPAPPSDERNYGIGPLVNKARKRFKKGWSFGSLSSLGIKRVGKLSQGNLTTDFGK